jgi:hypothetical protein
VGGRRECGGEKERRGLPFDVERRCRPNTCNIAHINIPGHLPNKERSVAYRRYLEDHELGVDDVGDVERRSRAPLTTTVAGGDKLVRVGEASPAPWRPVVFHEIPTEGAL